jgi:hypothetical protein
MAENENKGQGGPRLDSNDDQRAQQLVKRADAEPNEPPYTDQHGRGDRSDSAVSNSSSRTNYGTGRLGSSSSCEARR